MAMETTSSLLLSCAALAFAACAGEKPEVTAPAAPPAPAVDALPPPSAAEILDAAIEAAGGLAKIEAASSWTSTTKGVYMGMPYESKNAYKNGLVRMDLQMSGERMSMVMGADPCWMQSGPVVTACSQEDRQINRKTSAMGEAMRLAPLRRPGWEISARRADVDGRPADVFVVRNAAAGAEGMLIIDAETHSLLKSVYTATMHGQEGEVAVVPAEYEDLCGVRTPTRIVSTFDGAPYVEEEVVDLQCGPVDDAVFAEPPQVADGTVAVREVPPVTVACDVMKGPYDGIPAAFGRLMGFLGERKLEPAGAAQLLYVVCPADTKDPKKYVTEVCFPVGLVAPAAEEKTGEFVVKALPAAKVLSVYGVGPSDAKSAELAKRAMAEAKTRKLEPAGHMRQISYSDPATVPPEKQVHELQLPVR
jgi:effector-binding domain-containing protein